jgi:hypothetical protein
MDAWCALGLVLMIASVGAADQAMCAPTRFVVWAWERPEDLRFLPPDTEIAVQSGFVELSGDEVRARGRRFSLKARAGQVTTAVVHIQIDPRKPFADSDDAAHSFRHDPAHHSGLMPPT